MTDTYDTIIRNGTIIDGTGAPGVRADLAIRGDRIAAIGDLTDAAAAREIDATGHVVTPGFIDVHAHDDGAVMVTPMDFKLMQGVTTDIVGNCGAGIAPLRDRRMIPGVELIMGVTSDVTWDTFGEYMEAVAASMPAINVGCFVPHGVVRYKHLGMDQRAPDEGELAAMQDDIEEGMAAGALGFSTGLIYPPGRFARTEEVIELTRVAARHSGLYMSHIRNEAEELLEAVDEAITIGRESGVRVQISHHKASAQSVWGKTTESIAMIERANASGEDVAFVAYPYTAGSTVLSAALAFRGDIDADTIVVASTHHSPQYEGKSLAEIGRMLDIEDPHEIIRRVLSEEPAAVAVFHSMHEDDVRRVLAHPLCMIGSDGIPTPTGKPHPRLYSTFPRVLHRYVRDAKLMTLEEAIRKMTSLPADRFQLANRGRLTEGNFADIVIFNPDTIEDIATYEDPRQYPAGIAHVLVNGAVTAEGTRQTERHAGRLLRRGVA